MLHPNSLSAQANLPTSGGYISVMAETTTPFTSLVREDGEKLYFRLEMLQLGSWFERCYVVDQIFKNAKVVLLETKAKADTLIVFSHKPADPELICRELTAMREEALKMAMELPPDKIKEMLVRFEKFQ